MTVTIQPSALSDAGVVVWEETRIAYVMGNIRF